MNGSSKSSSRLANLTNLLKGANCDDSTKGKFESSKRKKVIFILLLVVLLAVVAIFVLGVGAVYVPFSETLKIFGHSLFPNYIDGPSVNYYTPIIYTYRAPRVIVGILAGVSLAVAGAAMQSILRNPLVCPFTLGLSSAASCGAAVAIVLGPTIFGSVYYTYINLWGTSITIGWIFMVIVAFAFGLISVAILLSLTSKRMVGQSTLILTGVVIGYLFSALLSYLKYASDETALKDITLWLLGGMWGASWSAVIILIPIVIVGVLFLESYAVDLNTLSSGDDVAKNLGVNVKKLRTKILIISALVTSACMAFTGIIGFIGLMAPHICRMIIGNDNRYLIPASALLGALILISSDAIARVILAPNDLPVGIIMYAIGGVFFLLLVKKMSGGYES
ncbi:FecCD family ABC transporter permease [Candidatus Methanomassiliicoccus intestinalis]|jgi:transport system permease protein|uniref:Transport system permease n=2 Tax=Candidatus Methanomassiliicoccus intestinalis TaxID=1406512 RepID=R9T620_METII|nr:iron ABC transporter permease [Candidatus Methanomassiliicoccus intestinalis]AGN26039.1 transport system permease [Candidatus Methanomassiliicoccus intestinalis Issoire-Mx1]TQS82165.1 MAG: iron ABC transporter permease [Candidatus Methanomassiliicoccus intestinalis]TQS84868.1 MAG: iron ABC transporter permease [Candidatus Methanomassiliicoccus intestinalis]